jgi:hypothetical protein
VEASDKELSIIAMMSEGIYIVNAVPRLSWILDLTLIDLE